MYQFIVNPGAGAGRGYRIWKRLEHQLEMNSQNTVSFLRNIKGMRRDRESTDGGKGWRR